MSKGRKSSLILGTILCLTALALAMGPTAAAILGWAVHYWPVALIGAGAAHLLMFALRRGSRPFSGALLLATGGLSLAYTLTNPTNPIEFYGTFWPVLLAVVAVADVVRQYGLRRAGVTAPLFTPGKAVLVGLIAVSGIAANRIAPLAPDLLARLQLPGVLAEALDYMFGEEFSFDAIHDRAELPPGTPLSITNPRGEIEVVGGDGNTVEVTMVPTVRAWDIESARATAEKLQVSVELSDGVLSVRTNRGELSGHLAAALVVRAPRWAAVQVSGSHGTVKASGLNAGLKVDGTHLNVSVDTVAGDVAVKGSHGDVTVTGIRGAVTVRSPRSDAVIKNVEGPVTLLNVHDVTVQDVVAPSVDVIEVYHAEVRLTRLSAQGGLTAVGVTGSHTDVRLADIRGNVKVRTNHAEIRATAIAGMMEVDASHTEIAANGVGSIKLVTSHDDVVVKNVEGAVEIANQHGGVVVDEFGGQCSVRTSFDDARLATSRAPAGPVNVETEHGGVELRLPVGPRYQFDTNVTRGQARIDPALSAAGGGAICPVTIRASYEDVVVRPSATADRA